MKGILLRNKKDEGMDALFPDSVKGLKDSQTYAERNGGKDAFRIQIITIDSSSTHLVNKLFQKGDIKP